MPKKGDRWLPKFALGVIEGKAALLHHLKNLPEMFEMQVAVGAAYQIVIGEGETERQIPKILIDEPLKCLAGVAQLKRHVVVLKKSEEGNYCSFGLICFSNRDMIVPLDKDQLAEDCGAVEVVACWATVTY